MASLRPHCGNCSVLLDFDIRNESTTITCPNCNNQILVEAFPALFRGIERGRPGESITLDDDASCFYHRGKKAVIPCESCGRFLCALCDVDFGGRHLCPPCIELGGTQAKTEKFRSEYVYYDRLALALAIFPLIIFYLTIITAPAALYFAVRHWNTRMSAVPRGKWRHVVAILFAGTEVAGWLFGLLYLIVKV